MFDFQFIKQFVRHVARGSVLKRQEMLRIGTLESSKCQDVIRLINSLEQDRKGKYYSNNSDFRVFNLDKVSNSNWIQDLGQKYCPNGMYLGTILGSHLHSGPDTLGSGEGWHRDSWFGQHKVMIYLHDVDCNNGAFEYITGTSKLKSKIFDFFHGCNDRYNDKSVKFRKKDIVTYQGQAGDILSFDPSGIHRGGTTVLSDRYSLTFYYFDNYVKKDQINAKFNQDNHELY